MEEAEMQNYNLANGFGTSCSLTFARFCFTTWNREIRFVQI